MSDYLFVDGYFADNSKGFGKIIDFENKDALFNYHMLNFQKKLKNMFTYDNLPDEIPIRNLELQIQRGYAIIYKFDGKLYQTYGGIGGRPDPNYLPTIATIANPALQMKSSDFKHKYKIYWGYEWETEEIQNLDYCVVIPNDSLFLGTIPTNSYYASQLVENDLTLNCNLINLRLLNLLVAGDDDAKKSLDKVIDNLKKGKISTAVDDGWVLEAIKSLPFGKDNSNNIVQLLEERQYIKGSWWNEWGVQSNYNMKRETITSSENILNVDSLYPIMDDMFECRKLAIDRVNKIFNTNIEVKFNSAWEKLRTEIKAKETILKNDANQKPNEKEVQNLDNGDDDGKSKNNNE